jgi:hypothetical protein
MLTMIPIPIPISLFKRIIALPRISLRCVAIIRTALQYLADTFTEYTWELSTLGYATFLTLDYEHAIQTALQNYNETITCVQLALCSHSHPLCFTHLKPRLNIRNEMTSLAPGIETVGWNGEEGRK